MKIATAMTEGRSTKTASTMSLFSRRRPRLIWVGEAAKPPSPETATVLFAKCCVSRHLHQLRLGRGDISTRIHIIERQVIVQQEALLGRGAVLEAGYQGVALPVLQGRQLIFVVLAQIGIGARRNRPFDRVEGVL